MTCQKCQQHPAAVRITRIINGEKSELQLCQECAAKMQGDAFQWDTQFPFNLLSSLFEETEPAIGFSQGDKRPPVDCSTCGQTYKDFRQTGKLGCGECYEIFNAQLAPVIRRIHGSESHTGKIPCRSGEKLTLKKEIGELKKQLRSLVEKEEFEQAAQIRDKIRAIEDKID